MTPNYASSTYNKINLNHLQAKVVDEHQLLNSGHNLKEEFKTYKTPDLKDLSTQIGPTPSYSNVHSVLSCRNRDNTISLIN